MRSRKIDHGPEWNNPSRINFLVGHVVMTLDMVDADRLGDSRVLIEIEHVALQIRVIDDAPKIAFEMPVINYIEANERAKETPIGFDHPVAKQVSAFRQTLFHFIERIEKFFARNFVSPLAHGEAGPVNSVVDVVVKKIGELGVLVFDVLREKIDVFVLGELVEDAVEDGTDVILAIVHDLLRFLVPEHRNSHPFFEIRIGRRVRLTQVMEAADRIGRFEVIEFV